MERNHCNKAYGGFHEMLKDPNLEAVAIFTPAPLHVEHCVDVLNGGKHVVCAVPAAFTLEQCQRPVDTVKKTGLTYMQAETGCYLTAHKLVDTFNPRGGTAHVV
jgi:predicted dehydrogenase